MRLDLGTFVANDLYLLDDHFESVTLELWRQLARTSQVILDVGSHIGTFALVASEANPRSRICAIEADPHNFELLRLHAQSRPNVTAIHAAIADRECRMWFCPEGNNDGGGYISDVRTEDARCREVETLTLPGLCKSMNIVSVDLVKLDVEGFEDALLAEGCSFWEEYAVQHLIVEMRIDRADARRTARIFETMGRRGFRAQRIQGLYAFPWMRKVDLANWLFTKRSRRDAAKL